MKANKKSLSRRNRTKVSAVTEPAGVHVQPSPAPQFPRVEFPVIKIPQSDGSILIKPGKAVVVGDEIGTAEFAKRTGISQRHVQYLCDVGHITARPLTDRPGSKYMIQVTEVDRFRKGRQS